VKIAGSRTGSCSSGRRRGARRSRGSTSRRGLRCLCSRACGRPARSSGALSGERISGVLLVFGGPRAGFAPGIGAGDASAAGGPPGVDGAPRGGAARGSAPAERARAVPLGGDWLRARQRLRGSEGAEGSEGSPSRVGRAGTPTRPSAWLAAPGLAITAWYKLAVWDDGPWLAASALVGGVMGLACGAWARRTRGETSRAEDRPGVDFYGVAREVSARLTKGFAGFTLLCAFTSVCAGCMMHHTRRPLFDGNGALHYRLRH
jgi:hypothetical protein